MSTTRLVSFLTFTALITGFVLSAQPKADVVMVYKDPSCGCCAKWVEHLQQHGFVVRVTQTTDMADVKKKNRVPAGAQSCHTALVGGYVVEGHVPAADLQRLLTQRPRDVVGLAVPGMPIGSPGMEVPGRPAQPFTVVAIDSAGQTRAFAAHGR